jgi:Arc/MetJ family transcription regulator
MLFRARGISESCAEDILAAVKHLVDLDDELLRRAMFRLGTSTIKATVGEALKIATERDRADLQAAMDRLADLGAEIPVLDRAHAW